MKLTDEQILEKGVKMENEKTFTFDVEKLRADIHAIVSNGCRLCDYWDAENYHCMLNIPIHSAYPCNLADQILALIPDKPPKDEPPLLNNISLNERAKNIVDSPYGNVRENVEWVAQAQRRVDIKYYETK